jgi:alcohol dehydrogenase class IV
MELRKFVAPEFIFGNDARLLINQYAYNLGGEKLLLVTDHDLQEYNWFKEIIECIDLEYVVYDKITVNPKDMECQSGAELYLEEDCNAIVAIGGGSVIDCAKGIGIIVSNGGNIRDYEGIDQIPMPMPPLLCIPTTSGSSADVSQFAIITQTDEDYKMVIASKMIVPDISLIDPVVTLTKSFDLTVDTGLDALVHAIEAYVSNASSTITDLHAKDAIQLISDYLPKLAVELDNLEYRGMVMQACLSAGLAFSNASLGLVHAMAHSLGGRYDLIHGELNGKLLEHVVRFNYDSEKSKYDKVAELISGEKIDTHPADVIHEFVENIRINTLVNQETTLLADIADYVLDDPCLVTNPKEVAKKDVIAIYEKIFRQGQDT